MTPGKRPFARGQRMEVKVIKYKTVCTAQLAHCRRPGLTVCNTLHWGLRTKTFDTLNSSCSMMPILSSVLWVRKAKAAHGRVVGHALLGLARLLLVLRIADVGRERHGLH